MYIGALNCAVSGIIITIILIVLTNNRLQTSVVRIVFFHFKSNRIVELLFEISN